MPLWQAAAAFSKAIGKRRTRGLAKPHPEIEQWPLVQALQQNAMSRLGRDMRDDAVIERPRVGGEQYCRGGGRGVAVQHDRYPAKPCRHHRTRDRGQFEPAEPAQHVERITGRRAVQRYRLANHTALVVECFSNHTGARAGPQRRVAAE